MRELREEEIKNMKGGISPSAIILIGAAITVLIGILDGISRPIACNK